MNAENPISLSELRRRIEFLRDHAVETVAMTPNERGQITGARNILAVVLDDLDRVQCSCASSEDTTAPPSRSTVLRLIAGDDLD